MKAAVFGANGYIGRHLVHSLIESDDYEISGFDIQESSFFDEIENYSYTSIDLRNQEQLSQLDLNFDLLFYFSGVTGTGIAFKEYEKFIGVNEIGLLNLLETLKANNQKPKVIFPSTRLVYKGNSKPLKEEDEKEFKTIYALNKYNGEQYLKMYHAYFGIDFLIFRICVPYGDIFNAQVSYGTIGFFLKSIQNKSVITLYGDGSQKRTFTHVMDICNQIISASIKSEQTSEIYNTGGEAFSLNEIALMFSEFFNISINHIEWPELSLKMESGDTVFDESKISKLLNYELQYSLRDWIEKTAKIDKTQ